MRPKSTEKQLQHGQVKSVPGNKVVLAKSVVRDADPAANYAELLAGDGNALSFVNKENVARNIVGKSVNNVVVVDANACDEVVTVSNSELCKKINCRLCDRDITGKECQLLYDQEENIETRLGRKINIIINSTETQLNLSQYCCSVCTSKIEICFSLLVEIQASDEVIKQTYEHLSSGVSVDTSTQLYICGECKSTITGIKAFIRHYENHILKKTVINSKRDLKVSRFVVEDAKDAEGNEIEGEDDFVDGIVSTLVGNDGGHAYERNEVEDEELDSRTKSAYRKRKRKKKKKSGRKSSNFDFAYGSSDEFYEKNTDIEDRELVVEKLSDNEFGLSLASDQDGDSPPAEKVDDDDDDDDDETEMSESETSVSSNASYDKLVDIVKKELEKSDSDEDANFEMSVDRDGNYYCSTCNQSFQYKFLLVHHITRDHKWTGVADESGSEAAKDELNDSYIHCPDCQRSVLPSEIQKHLIKCGGKGSGEILCHTCGRFCTLRQWPNHRKKHANPGGMWSCDLCGKRFKAKRILRSHLGEHDESKKKVCEICGKKLLPLSFFSHMMKHKEKRHVCQFCGKGFTYNYGLRMHLKVHEGSEKLYSKPGKKKDKVFCWLCKKDFDSSSSLHRHLKNVHNIEGIEQDSRFSCSECDKKFADMFGLKAHLKLIHEMKDEEISRFKSLPVYRYIECNVCNQVFNSENKVRIHMKQDHGLKPFEMEILKKECEKCGKRFASKQNLIHHINGAHLNIKPMQCDICSERFAKHSSLIYHKLRHSGEKPFQCEHCHKTYRQRNDVIRHLARHVRDQELTLEEASAINNSPSPMVIKRRIFLKDSSISYRALVTRNRNSNSNMRRPKAEIVEIGQPVMMEPKMEYDEGSLIYVEGVMAEEIQAPESPTEMKYMTVKPIYNEERNTIILSSPDLFKNAGVENVSCRYVTHQGKEVPAVIVKKETEM